jgi:PleD family two-component response regulator
VLVVDDQPLSAHALHQTLAAHCQVLVATSGEAALELCGTRPPDLVLLDVSMPGIDGLEVCTRLKADPGTRDIPVIFVTGQDDATTQCRGLAAGAADFISKPINPAIVRARTASQLTIRRLTALLREQAVPALADRPGQRMRDLAIAHSGSASTGVR